ncbi:DUF4406 domain-containing protein [Stenotrophomonas lacuserhaii]|uniref:DUF4406 domain-containing protein n=1 Tax=Stenotrophomonas lacuserhaii TaxID=2760084 RepID=UPI001C718684|nr:DUF4406 domain-containing protein [Stenotrophomonas lacuserhaii]
MDAKAKILSPTADDLRQLIICDTDFSEAGETDLNVDTMQRLEQLGWLAEGEESGEYALTNAGRLAVRRALGEVVAFVQFKADRIGRTYIAGPMTGYTDFNYPAFNDAAAQLRSLGIAAINPADHGVVQGATWEDYLRSDIAQLATCESIYFLPGWSKSRGALLEHHIATSLGMRLLFADGAEKREAVRLRDELRERAEFEASYRSLDMTRDGQGYSASDTNYTWSVWQAALAATGKQQVGEVQGDGLAALVADWETRYGVTDAYRICAGELKDALAARQRVGPNDCACIYYGLGKAAYICERHRNAAPPAQAVDLGQFRECVELMEWQERGHANPDFPVGDPKKHAEALRLLALIDGKAVGNG